ncbi:hypothetical protein A8C32_01525 [Flavivirga aquatica]|uniref:Uncharacterized protein n=1 Tax=Flavivirga aquatica TaxID=1849968 RepID=A0A1E5T9X1_9FLAO|nr:hypothetical protein [Flavivirga aquatica]OEK08169.1 hypothetical protein A8C32_01525 [Flavivirga aquatica]
MKIKNLATIIIYASILFTSCNEKKDNAEHIVKNKAIATSKASFKAIPMPKKLISGMLFPTDSIIINKWISNPKYNNVKAGHFENNPEIINHGWDIWEALTAFTSETYDNQKLRRFETWYTPEDIKGALTDQLLNKNKITLKNIKRTRGKLKVPSQFHTGKGLNTSTGDIVSFVKYDPSAANHIFDNKLFLKSKLNAISKSGARFPQIKDFPTSGVVLKPIFDPLTDADLAKEKCSDCYKIAVWPGEQNNPERKFGEDAWNYFAYVTLTGKTDKDKSIFSVNEFIHFKADSTIAKSRNIKTGDFLILKAMHVTTRETKRWTWQSFWWSPNPDNPFKPSTETIASQRPKQLDGASKHYAMSIAYSMVKPVQPYFGGSGKNANSLYAYNPYLEAGFGPFQVIKDDVAIGGTFSTGNQFVQAYNIDQRVGNQLNLFGMQTNCMSCHGQARYIPGITTSNSSSHLYITNQYFDLNAPYFKNNVKLDFTWSIQGNLIDDKKLITSKNKNLALNQ